VGPRPGVLARGTRIVGGERRACNGLGVLTALIVSPEQRRPVDPRTMTERPDDSSQREAGATPDTAADVDPDVSQLLGLRPADAGPLPTADEIDSMGEITDTRVYQGDLEARPLGSDQPDEPAAENLDFLVQTELRDGETDDPGEAAEEGLTWVPPIDPPLRIADDGPEVAAGFGTTAADEPFDADHHAQAMSPQDEVEARVMEALHADSATAGLVDGLELDAEGGVVRIAGVVPDLDDEDAVLAVVESVVGVDVVDSRIEVRAVAEAGTSDPR
jgi:hypothetical protein